MDSVLSPRSEWMLWWTSIIKRSLTIAPSHELLCFCHSLLSLQWVLGASCQQMVGSNSGKFANKGLSPLQPAGSSINLLAALLFTSQESSSGQNMYSVLAVQSRKTFFSDEKVLLNRCIPKKIPPWFLTINVSYWSIWHTHSGEKEENISRLKFQRSLSSLWW